MTFNIKANINPQIEKALKEKGIDPKAYEKYLLKGTGIFQWISFNDAYGGFCLPPLEGIRILQQEHVTIKSIDGNS